MIMVRMNVMCVWVLVDVSVCQVWAVAAVPPRVALAQRAVAACPPLHLPRTTTTPSTNLLTYYWLLTD